MSRRTGVMFDLEPAAAFSVDPQARTITGLAVPWNQAARNGGRRWRFERGSIKYSAVNRVKLLRDHDHSQAIGKAIAIDDTPEGLVVTFRVSPGRAGDDALALAMDEVLDGLSIGVEWRDEDFGPDPLNEFSGGFLVKQAALREVSLTAVPAFDDSRLTSVRASDDAEEEPVMPEKPEETAPATQPVTAPTTPPEPTMVTYTKAVPAAEQPAERTYSLAEIKAFSEQFGARPAPAVEAPKPVEVRPVVDPTAQAATFAASGAAQVSEPLPYRFTYQPRTGTEAGKHIFHTGQKHDFSTDLFKFIDSNGSDTEAGKRVNALISAVFDVDTTDVAGTIPARQAPELWQPQMDYATPLWDMINAGTTDGRPFILPKFSSASGLVVPAVEGTEPAPGAMAVTTQTVTPTAVWGKVEITRQAIRQGGNPQISGIIWDQMLREYYEDREAAVATFLNTLTAATDITVTAPTGAADNDEDQASVASLEAAIADLMFVRGGNRFTAFAVQQGLFRVLARVKDDAGRPLYPMINPQNSNGTAAPLFKTIDFAGTTAVPSWALGPAITDAANSWLFDPAKVRGWASAPERLDWNFGATVQTANIPQLSHVTMGIYGDIALANLDIAGVRQVIFDAVGS